MLYLSISNITDTPYEFVVSKISSAIGEAVSNGEIEEPEYSEVCNFITSVFKSAEETADNLRANELIWFVDNFLVNTDFYSELKDHFSK